MVLIYEIVMEFKVKIMLHYLMEVKRWQGFTPGVTY